MSQRRMVRVYAKQPVNYFQDGGMQQMQAPQQQMDPQQIMQIIQMFAQITGNDPEQVMAQFQQLGPNEQMQAVDQMVQTIQSQEMQQNDQVAAATMPQAPPAGSGMSTSEEMAQMEAAPGEGEMAEEMMRLGGMYAKSQKKLLKKAIGGTIAKNGDTSKSIQQKLGEVVKAAIGLNFTENLIDNSAKGFNQRNANQFDVGGTTPNNPYFTSADEAAKESFKDQMSSKWLFDERLENALDQSNYNPYLQIKGKALGKGYNIFNRPKFTQNVYGADIESTGYGALFPENIPSPQQNGGQPYLKRFQVAGQADLEKAQKEQVLKLSDAHAKGMISDDEYMATMNKLDEEYANLVDPKGVADYNDESQDKGTGYDYNLRWKGNLDKATENLYLKDADIKTGFFNRKNIRRAKLTFGERGTGIGIPGETPTVNGEANTRIDSKGNLLYDEPGTTSTYGDVSDAKLARMQERGDRRIARNRDRYARIFGEDAAAKQFDDEMPVTASSNFGTGPYAGLFDFAQQQQNAANQAAAGAQSIMNIGTQGTTGNYMDMMGQNPLGYRFGGLTKAQDGIPVAPAPASSTNVVMPRTGPTSMEEVIAANDLYNKMVALNQDPTAVVGFANPNPGLMQDSVFYYPGQTQFGYTPYQIGRDRNNNVLYGVTENAPSLDQMVKYGNITTGDAGVGYGNTYLDIAGSKTERRYLPMYRYSGRPEVLYMKSPDGKWMINTDGDPDGQFVPIKDPEGKRTKTLNAQARRDYSFNKPAPSFRFGGMSNFGYGLPLAQDGINNFESEEDKFQITMKEKSDASSQWAPVAMAGIQNFADSINTARALQSRNNAYNVALNSAVAPGDMVGSLGSFTQTTGPSVFMPNLTQGMMQGRFGAAAPEQMTGMYYTQFGGQPNIAGLNVGDDTYMTDQEIEAFMKMGGKVEYY